MGKNLTRLLDKKVIDPDAAKSLDKKVIDKLEKMTPEEIDTVIKFKLDISGEQPWEPDADGSIF